MTVKDCYIHSLDELSKIGASLNYSEIETATEIIAQHQRIFFTAMGRSGNSARAIAIRFMHLGKDVFVALEASTPAIREGDLLIAISSSGKTTMIQNHIETALKNNADVIVITSNPSSIAINGAVSLVTVPDKKQVPSKQHAGSLFEQAVLLIGDAIATHLIESQGLNKSYLDSRHANLQ